MPKRSEERVRRNKDDVEIDTIEMIGPVETPDLDIEDPHPLIADLYDSLGESGQSKFYEPSDWQQARIVCHFLDGLVKSARPSGQMLAVIHSMMTDLLISEGARRRVRLEIEREKAKAEIFNIADILREHTPK